MTDTDPVFPMAGYVVLRVTAGTRYKGIDRSPFEPEVLEDEIASNPGPSGQIYTLYPPGWRRDALHVFEDGLVTGTGVGVYLVRTIETATTICELVSRHLAPHDVLACTIWQVGDQRAEADNQHQGFLGFDVAYLGGDHYSAVLNGLLLNPHPDLLKRYGGALNDAGLFSTTQDIPGYVRDFRRYVPSEAESVFHVHSLCLAMDVPTIQPT